MPVNNLITIRKGTEAQWNLSNPILASGEMGYDLTNSSLKIGNGVTSWSDLTSQRVPLNDSVTSSMIATNQVMTFNRLILEGSGLPLTIKNNSNLIQFLINNSGVIIVGSWKADPIDIAYGGTNSTTASGALNNLGASPLIHNHVSSDITDFNSSVSGLISGIYAPLTGSLNQFGSTTSSQLSSVISDETGSGLLVFNNSPNFTGIPTVPTASSGTNTNQIASTSFVRNEISNLVGSAPSALDTLNELASALGNDANFSTTVTNSLSQKANLSGANFSGNISAPSGDFVVLKQNGTVVSVSGHSHISSDITNFNNSVSGLLPVTNITGGSNITVSQSGTVYTVAVTGSLGLTTEEVDDRVSNLLVAGSGINLTYDDPNNLLTISVSGLTSSAIIGNGSGNVISYNLNEALNVVGSGSTTVTYNDSTNTINIGSPSLIREYELVNSTKSTFSVTGGYALNNLDVYHNGIKLLASGDYSATNGTSFSLIQPAVSGDVVEWLGYSVVPRHQLILGEVRSDTVGNINYLGRAVAGSSEGSNVWTIKRYTVANNGIDITTATASNASWTNRLSSSYI